jgi:hypothetical protein
LRHTEVALLQLAFLQLAIPIARTAFVVHTTPARRVGFAVLCFQSRLRRFNRRQTCLASRNLGRQILLQLKPNQTKAKREDAAARAKTEPLA